MTSGSTDALGPRRATVVCEGPGAVASAVVDLPTGVARPVATARAMAAAAAVVRDVMTAGEPSEAIIQAAGRQGTGLGASRVRNATARQTGLDRPAGRAQLTASAAVPDAMVTVRRTEIEERPLTAWAAGTAMVTVRRTEVEERTLIAGAVSTAGLWVETLALAATGDVRPTAARARRTNGREETTGPRTSAMVRAGDAMTAASGQAAETTDPRTSAMVRAEDAMTAASGRGVTVTAVRLASATPGSIVRRAQQEVPPSSVLLTALIGCRRPSCPTAWSRRCWTARSCAI